MGGASEIINRQLTCKCLRTKQVAGLMLVPHLSNTLICVYDILRDTLLGVDDRTESC
ncbi:Hypothetical predicted protein [Scomber scombrus]|uniref:Uncharacterized protein n=1 Tax=Scomber scombrus TaxID=13677 RepID=A0AAV1N2I1_SCOSC